MRRKGEAGTVSPSLHLYAFLYSVKKMDAPF